MSYTFLKFYTLPKLGFYLGDFYVSEELQLILIEFGLVLLLILIVVKATRKGSKKIDEGRIVRQSDYQPISSDSLLKNKKDEIVKKKGGYKRSSIDDFLEINFLKAKKNIEKQISKTYLTGYLWVLLNNSDDFVLYTFKGNGELMITKNGEVKIASYDLLSDNQSIIIKGDKIEHFEISFAKNNLLLLLKLGTNDSLFFGNYTKFKNKSIEYIDSYLSKHI